MSFKLAQSMRKGLVRLIWLGAALAMVVQALYVYKFVYVPGGWFTLSPSKTEWGAYGDFVGGMLGPYFSFLAFIAVALTVILQARQLDEIKAQSSLEEIQRVMTTVAARIDGMLAAPVQLELESVRPLAVPQSLFEFIAALGTHKLHERLPQKLANGETNFVQWLWPEISAKLISLLEMQSIAVRLELEALAWMLTKYRAQDGNATVIEYYEYRYSAVLVWLDELGLLHSHSLIQDFFRPKEARKHLHPDLPATSHGDAA